MAGDTPVLVHNCGTGGAGSGVEAGTPRSGVSIYRTPKAGDLAHELKNGPNPASHMDGDRSVYFGEQSVAAEYQGRAHMLME